jgi:hypothetical protein
MTIFLLIDLPLGSPCLAFLVSRDKLGPFVKVISILGMLMDGLGSVRIIFSRDAPSFKAIEAIAIDSLASGFSFGSSAVKPSPCIG